MRSNPVGRIVRNLLEAERKKAAYKEWVDNLFHPIGHLDEDYDKPLGIGEKAMRSPYLGGKPEKMENHSFG